MRFPSEDIGNRCPLTIYESLAGIGPNEYPHTGHYSHQLHHGAALILLALY